MFILDSVQNIIQTIKMWFTKRIEILVKYLQFWYPSKI